MTGHYNYISNTHMTFVNVMKKIRHLHHFHRKKIAKTVLCGQEETENKGVIKKLPLINALFQ